MGTAFCSNCGFIIAHNVEDAAEAIRESGLAACPECGATQGVGWSPSHVTREELRGALNPTPPATREEARLRELANDLMRDDGGRKRAARWLRSIGLTTLVAAAIIGAVTYFLTGDWLDTLLFGLFGGFAAAWIVDRFLPQP